MCERSSASEGSNSNVTVTVSSASRDSSAATSSSRPSPASAETVSAPGIQRCEPVARRGIELIDLVEDLEPRHAIGLHLDEHRLDCGHVTLAIDARRVDDVQQEVCARHLFQRRTERRDERVREPIDEADGVRNEQLPTIR